MPTPVDFCHGVTRLADALGVVDAGQTVLAGDVHVGKANRLVHGHYLEVPVIHFHRMAGMAEAGHPREIEVSTNHVESNPLPAGRYFVLLGVTSTQGRYFLSDGISGSFELDAHGRVRERCASSDSDGSIGESQLANLIGKAIAQAGTSDLASASASNSPGD